MKLLRKIFIYQKILDLNKTLKCEEFENKIKTLSEKQKASNEENIGLKKEIEILKKERKSNKNFAEH